MFSSKLLAVFALALVPAAVEAAIFPKDTIVRMLDPKSFKQVMKRNESSLVAFVAPWCGVSNVQNFPPHLSNDRLALSTDGTRVQ